MDTRLRYELLLVPTRDLEKIYVRKFSDSIERYDKKHHVIYFKHSDPNIVCTLFSSFKVLDGLEIYISTINVAFVKSYTADRMNKFVKEASNVIASSHAIYPPKKVKLKENEDEASN